MTWREDHRPRRNGRQMPCCGHGLALAMGGAGALLLLLLLLVGSIYGSVLLPPGGLPAYVWKSGLRATSGFDDDDGYGDGNKQQRRELKEMYEESGFGQHHDDHDEDGDDANNNNYRYLGEGEGLRRWLQLQPPFLSIPTPTPTPNLTDSFTRGPQDAATNATDTATNQVTALASEASFKQSEAEMKAKEQISTLEARFTEYLREKYSFCTKDLTEDREQTLTYQGSAEAYMRCQDAEGGQGVLLTLCSVEEAKIYFQSLIPSPQPGLTQDPGVPRVPNNRNCNRSAGGTYIRGCAPGFASNAIYFPGTNEAILEMEPERTNFLPRPCCDGFFCPEGLACMMPCPRGGYCVESTVSNGSYPYCAPYEYQPSLGLGCGGANFWGIASRSQAMFCPEGYFCNTTTEKMNCSAGHYCRRGSVKPLPCLIPRFCDTQEKNQDLYHLGLFGVVVLLATLVALYHCSERAMQYRVAHHDKVRERLDIKEATRSKVQRKWRDVASRAMEMTRSMPRDSMDYARAESGLSEASDTSFYSSPARLGFGQIVKEVVEHEDMGSHGSVGLEIKLEFTNLALTLRVSGKKILDNITGELLPGRVTAVMGPSGAGKTTFLTALAGKKSNQTILSGKVLVNGKEDNIRAYKRIIGFVPQDDIVHANLTVEENLWFSARYRLPSKMKEKVKAAVVERTLKALGLSAIRHAQVGSVERRGISGGQRKRVNVGVEMVMEPSLLILDEPTSGLDSTSSRLVIQALRREAKRMVNVGVVLHQPSYTIFRLFHDVMFLAKGGRVVYHGPVSAVEEYFDQLGFTIPERINPPDYIMDVLDGYVKSSKENFKNESLPECWAMYSGRVTTLGSSIGGHPTGIRAWRTPKLASLGSQSSDSTGTSGRSSMPTVAEDIALEVEQAAARTNDRPLGYFELDVTEDMKTPISKEATYQPSDGGLVVQSKGFWKRQWQQFVDDMSEDYLPVPDKSGRKTPGFFTQLFLVMRRCGKQRLREPLLQLQDFVILLITGLIMGLLSAVNENTLGAEIYPNTILAVSLLLMIAALRTFSADLLTYWRESASGINRISYFLAKDIIDWLHVVLKPLFYLMVFFFFTNPRSTFVRNYAVTVCVAYCVTGIAYVFSIVFKPQPAQLSAAVFVLVSTLVAARPPGRFPWIQNFSYAAWAFEAYVIINAARYSGAWILTRCAVLWRRNFNINNFSRDLYVLLAAGAVARIIALICLCMCNRKKQR